MDSLFTKEHNVPSYEDLSKEFWDIMHVPVYGGAIKMKCMNPINKNFGLTHFAVLTTGRKRNPQADQRFYQLGAYYKKTLDPILNRRFLLVSFLSTTGLGKSDLTFSWSPRTKFRVKSQIYANNMEHFSATAVHKGSDFTVSGRTALDDKGPMFGGSYLQQMSEKLQLGGEAYLFPRLLNPFLQSSLSKSASSVAAAAAPPTSHPLKYSIGAAYDSGAWKGLMHYVKETDTDHGLVTQLKHWVTDNTLMVARLDTRFPSLSSQATASYRVKLPRTRSTVQGSINSLGTVRMSFERQLLSSVKMTVTGHTNPLREIPLAVGVQLQTGFFPEMEETSTPCLCDSRIFNS